MTAKFDLCYAATSYRPMENWISVEFLIHGADQTADNTRVECSWLGTTAGRRECHRVGRSRTNRRAISRPQCAFSIQSIERL